MLGYVYITPPLGIAGPRFIQVVRADGLQTHHYIPPYQADPDQDLRGKVLQLCVQIGVTRVGWVEPWGTYPMKCGLPLEERHKLDRELQVYCGQLGRTRMRQWVESYPGAKEIFGWDLVAPWRAVSVMMIASKGVDWGLFRWYPLRYFLYYLEWYVRHQPRQFYKYRHLLHDPPLWFRLSYGERVTCRRSPSTIWNPYYLPQERTLDEDQIRRLKPDD